MVELAVRLVFSLAVVVGLLLLTVKVGGRKFRPRNGAAVRIVHRQALSRGTAVAVVEVGNRVLVLGTTEHQVNVLAELDEGELEGPGGTDRADLTLVDNTLDPASQVIALEEVRVARADPPRGGAGADPGSSAGQPRRPTGPQRARQRRRSPARRLRPPRTARWPARSSPHRPGARRWVPLPDELRERGIAHADAHRRAVRGLRAVDLRASRCRERGHHGLGAARQRPPR